MSDVGAGSQVNPRNEGIWEASSNAADFVWMVRSVRHVHILDHEHDRRPGSHQRQSVCVEVLQIGVLWESDLFLHAHLHSPRQHTGDREQDHSERQNGTSDPLAMRGQEKRNVSVRDESLKGILRNRLLDLLRRRSSFPDIVLRPVRE